MVDQESAWVDLRKIANNLKKLDPAFDPRTYGSSKLVKVIAARSDAFEVRPRPDSTPHHGPHQGLTAERDFVPGARGSRLSYARGRGGHRRRRCRQAPTWCGCLPRATRASSTESVPFATLIDASFPDYRHPVLVFKTEEPGTKQKLAVAHARTVRCASIWSTISSTTSW